MSLVFERWDPASQPPPDSGPGGIEPCATDTVRGHGAGEHWLAHSDGVLVARCSLWWRATPLYDGRELGVIGHFAAAPGAPAKQLLAHACARLARHGATQAVGPMDGNTWRGYRLVSDAGSEPPFFLEPWTPLEWNDHFRAAGFAAVAGYHSSVTEDLTWVDPRVPRVADRLRGAGVTLRNLDAARFEAELAAIHALSCVSFAHNFLYTPIARDEFIAQYRPIAQYVDPRLVLLAERDGEMVGFLFAIPDITEAARRGRVRSAVIKTVAVHPDRRLAGLGAWLAAECHARAAAAGFERIVHALMHDANKSGNISRRYARVLRRYTLYGRALPPP
ncbi:MAG: N-acetyltransferase family protein [Gammaproteobacteria bacterium]